jgi:hypothetical protein
MTNEKVIAIVVGGTLGLLLFVRLLGAWIADIAREVYREESGQKAKDWEAVDRRLTAVHELTREDSR